MKYIDPRHKVLHHVDRLYELRMAGKTAAPVNAEIDLSNRCSLGCEWCHFAYTHTRGPLAGKRAKPDGAEPGGDVMDTTLALSIIDQLAGAGVRSVTWTGGGEPTLHPDFDDIVEHTATTPLAQGIYTHGGHINDDRAALLKRALTWVYISLDECSSVAYKRSKGVDRFEAVKRNVRRLVAAEGRATIGVGFLLHPDNYQHAARMAWLALEQLGADYVQFRPTVRYEQERPGVPAERTSWLDACVALLEGFDDPRVYADVERFRLYQTWQGHGYNVCHWSAMQTVITPNGRMWVCVNKREYPGACVGDLRRETFSDVWRRVTPCAVDEACRVMCRGHMGNLTLDAVMTPPPHEDFI